jgi:hypothetical protein
MSVKGGFGRPGESDAMGGRSGAFRSLSGVAGRSDSKNKIDIEKCMTFLVTNSGPCQVAL